MITPIDNASAMHYAFHDQEDRPVFQVACCELAGCFYPVALDPLSSPWNDAGLEFLVQTAPGCLVRAIFGKPRRTDHHAPGNSMFQLFTFPASPCPPTL